jgi:hypothetical protein
VWLERLGQIKRCNHLIRHRTRHIPAGSIVCPLTDAKVTTMCCEILNHPFHNSNCASVDFCLDESGCTQEDKMKIMMAHIWLPELVCSLDKAHYAARMVGKLCSCKERKS